MGRRSETSVQKFVLLHIGRRVEVSWDEGAPEKRGRGANSADVSLGPDRLKA